MIKAVIFDLDGVIVSTDDLHYNAWKLIAERENIYFDKDINNRLRGVSRMESLDIILEKAIKDYSDEEKLALAEEKNRFYVKLLNGLSEKDVIKNVKELISELKNKEIKVAIGSSSKNTMKILNKIGLLEAFDAIADGNDITNSKPAPDVFLVAAKKLNINANECIVVEDAVAGIEAAKAANMKAVAIGDAKNSNIADYKIENILDVLKYIG